MSGQQNATIHLTLDGGINQSTYSRHVPQTDLLDALNVRFSNLGGAQKRPGCTAFANAFTGASLVAGAGRLAKLRGELLLSDGYTFGSATTAPAGSETFIAKDRAPEAVPSLTQIAGSPFAMSSPDMAFCSANGGYFIYAWCSGANSGSLGDIFVTVQDATTGAELQSSVALSSGAVYQCPRIAVVGSTVMVWYIDNASHIVVRIWQPATQTWTGAVNKITDANAGALIYFDLACTASAVYLVYRNTANAVIVDKFDATPTLLATKTSTEASTTCYGFGISATAGEYIAITYNTASGGNTLTRVAGYNDTLTTETRAPTTVFTSVTATEEQFATASCRVTAARTMILIGSVRSGTNFVGQTVRSTLFDMSTGAAVGSSVPTGRCTFWSGMSSRPFVASANPLRVCAWISGGAARYDSPNAGEQPFQWTAFLVDLWADDTTTTNLPPRPICWVAPRFAEPEIAQATPPCSAVNIGNQWHALIRLLASGIRLTLARATADFAHSNRFATAELGSTLYMVPGFVWDRGKLFEQSFAWWPQKVSTPTFSNTGGALTSGGKYRRRVVYEWIDNAGNRHQSQPSEFTEFTVSGGNDTATYSAPCLSLTKRQQATVNFQPQISIVVYGTGDINAGADANTYYRVFSQANTPKNDVTAESVTIVDKGNTNLTSQAQLYTQGGVLPNVMPSGFSAIAAYRNRVWVAYGNTVAYSKAQVEGDALSFTDAFTLPLETSDTITALWVMDDTLYISTSSRIYFLQADGPADNGTQNDVSTPNQVACDQGCIEPRSVVTTPVGTFFQSARGIELLDRARQVSTTPIGAKVAREQATYPTVTSATEHPDANGGWVTFSCTNGSFGERLVYHYATGKWARDSVLGADGAGKQILSSIVLNNILYFLTSDGNVYAESPTLYTDAGSWVTAKVSTAWIHASGLQGYQWVHRILWQGERATSINLQVDMFADYTAAFSHQWGFVANAQLDTYPLYQVGMDPPTQRTQAVRFDIYDGVPTGAAIGTGQGALFAGLTLDVETGGRSWELPAVQKG